MVTNRLSIRTPQLRVLGVIVPAVLVALACSGALTPKPGHLLLGTWSSHAASLTADPSVAGLVLPCLKVRLQPLRLDDSSRFEVTGIIASVRGSVPRHRGDPFPLSGQVVGDRVVLYYPWVLQNVGVDTLAPGHRDVSMCNS
jgi:hypothetical protein